MLSPSKGRIKALCRYLTLPLGAAILAFGLYNVHGPSNITEGGVLGMTLLLKHWFNISPGISGFLMDATCYIIGYKYLGKQFAINSVIASTGFAVSYSIFERFPPILPNLGDNPILAAILGGLFVGVGVGLVVRMGGAAGGDDALALVISNAFKWKISKAYLFTDIVVLTLSISYIPLNKILCSLITVTISSFVIGFLHNKEEQQDAPKEV